MAINIDNVGRIMEDYANEAYSYKEAFKILKRTQLDVDNLRSIVKNYKVVPKSITDHHLLCFLFEGYNLDNAANRVKLYYEIKLNNPHLFKVRDPESPEVQQCLRSQNYFYMSATPEKKSVLYVSLIDYRASSWCFDNFVKTFIMLCESCLISQGPQKGLIFVIDMKGASLAHLSKPNIKTVITIIKFAFYASPILISAVHILNTPSFFHIIMKIFLRPFISREFEKLLFLYKDDMEWEEFYKHGVPKSSLPSNYGGDLDTIEVLHAEHCKKLIELKGYFEAESVQAFLTQKR